MQRGCDGQSEKEPHHYKSIDKVQPGQHVVMKPFITGKHVDKQSTARPACDAARADLITDEHVDKVRQGQHVVMEGQTSSLVNM